MANVKLSWQLPSLRDSGKPIDPATIKHVEIAISGDGGESWAVTDVFTPDVLETMFTDLEPGLWKWRGVTVDTSDRRATKEAFAELLIADESAPGALTLEAVLA